MVCFMDIMCIAIIDLIMQHYKKGHDSKIVRLLLIHSINNDILSTETELGDIGLTLQLVSQAFNLDTCPRTTYTIVQRLPPTNFYSFYFKDRLRHQISDKDICPEILSVTHPDVFQSIVCFSVLSYRSRHVHNLDFGFCVLNQKAALSSFLSLSHQMDPQMDTATFYWSIGSVGSQHVMLHTIISRRSKSPNLCFMCL